MTLHNHPLPIKGPKPSLELKELKESGDVALVSSLTDRSQTYCGSMRVDAAPRTALSLRALSPYCDYSKTSSLFAGFPL